MKNDNQPQAKRTSIEDAIRAANLENYSFSKKENEIQTNASANKSQKNYSLKADSNVSWKNLNSLTSTLDFLPKNKSDDSKKVTAKEEPSVSALFALFQKEINEIEHENESSSSKNPPQTQSEEFLIANLEKKKKKTRWEKPIAVPQMTNANILGPQQQPSFLYNNPNSEFNNVTAYQNIAITPNNFSFSSSNQFGGVGPNRFSNQVTNFNAQGAQTTWGGYNSSQYGNMNNRSNVNVHNEKLEQKKSPVENYVTRAFEKCQNEKDRQLTEKALKKILNNAKLRGDFETRDWDNFPLPTIGPEQRFGAAAHAFNVDKNMNMEVETVNKARSEIEGPIKVGTLLQKRGLKNLNPEEPRMEIGINEKGKKIIKTLNKAANKAKLEISKEEEERRKQRQGRFQEDFSKKLEYKEDFKPSKFMVDLDTLEEAEADLETLAEKWKVVGTSTALEKPYLRLTKEPDPSMIRPEPILKKSLKMVLDKWKNKEVSYPYVAEQFRSIRQDLTVQHIKNDFTIKVYESNARISLESHDVKYFNQCQSWLKDLYGSGVPSKNKPEFFSYRILHLTLVGMKNDLNQLLQELTNEELSHEYIKFALELRRHMENGNIKGVFNLYKNGVNLTSYLLDIFIHRVRIWALEIICKSFGDQTPLDYLTDLLAFQSEEDLKEFVKKTDGVLTEKEDALQNKASFKIYHDHPWMKMKLQTFKAAHG